jgi:hypothetical protein
MWFSSAVLVTAPPAVQEALSSILHIPAHLLPPVESAAAVPVLATTPASQQAPLPREEHLAVKRALQFSAGKHQQAAAAADRRQADPVSSTPSSSLLPVGGSLIGRVATAREDVVPPGGRCPPLGGPLPPFPLHLHPLNRPWRLFHSECCRCLERPCPRCVC